MPKIKTKALSVFAVHYAFKTAPSVTAKMDVTAMSPDDARLAFHAKIGKGLALVSKVKFLREASEEENHAPANKLKPHEVPLYGL